MDRQRIEVRMDEDVEQSSKFGNSEESQHPESRPQRVSETTETTVTLETTLLWRQQRGQLLWRHQRGWLLWRHRRTLVCCYGNSSTRLCSAVLQMSQFRDNIKNYNMLILDELILDLNAFWEQSCKALWDSEYVRLKPVKLNEMFQCVETS